MTCPVCRWRLVRRWGRCDACAAYWRRTGRDRPEELVVAHGRRILERRLDANPGDWIVKAVRPRQHGRR